MAEFNPDTVLAEIAAAGSPQALVDIRISVLGRRGSQVLTPEDGITVKQWAPYGLG